MDYLTFNDHGGAEWYTAATQKIRDRFGDDADLFCDILAATSPQCDVRENVKLALDAYDRQKRGLPVTGWLPNHRINLERIRRGEKIRGPKVEAFARALKGDTTATVVDTWMLRAAGYGSKRRVKSPRSFRITRDAIELAAAWAGIPNSEAQARIWTAYRSENWEARRGAGDGTLPL